MQSDYLSVEEAARIVGLHPDSIRNFIKRKELPATKLGRVYRIKKEDFEKFLRERSTKDEKD